MLGLWPYEGLSLCSGLDVDSFVLLKFPHQWSSGTPPAFCISDPGEGEGKDVVLLLQHEVGRL